MQVRWKPPWPRRTAANGRIVLAATVRVTRDLDLAEECVQDAYARALATWPTSGIPAKTGAWLTTVARRRAIDLSRRHATQERALPLLIDRTAAPEANEPDTPKSPMTASGSCSPAVTPPSPSRPRSPSRSGCCAV